MANSSLGINEKGPAEAPAGLSIRTEDITVALAQGGLRAWPF